MLALIPLAISLAPELANWLFGPGAERTTQAVTQAVQAVTGIDPRTADGVAAARALLDGKPDAAAELRAKLAQIASQHEADARKADLDTLRSLIMAGQQQTDINKVEAAAGSVFVAGWRPFIGWVCGAGLAAVYVALPLFRVGIAIWHDEQPPPIPTDDLMMLLATMLGMGGLRTWEKLKGVAGADPR
jgi:hypothetical protein